jgi:hypothetical protein
VIRRAQAAAALAAANQEQCHSCPTLLGLQQTRLATLRIKAQPPVSSLHIHQLHNQDTTSNEAETLSSLQNTDYFGRFSQQPARQTLTRSCTPTPHKKAVHCTCCCCGCGNAPAASSPGTATSSSYSRVTAAAPERRNSDCCWAHHHKGSRCPPKSAQPTKRINGAKPNNTQEAHRQLNYAGNATVCAAMCYNTRGSSYCSSTRPEPHPLLSTLNFIFLDRWYNCNHTRPAAQC